MNRPKKKKHMFISMDAHKTRDKMQHPLKTLSILGMEGGFFDWIKYIHKKKERKLQLTPY